MASVGIVIGLVAAIAVACASPAEESGLAGKETIRIATKIDEPGIGNYTDPSGAARAGLDIDVATYVADKLGVAFQWEEVVSESREDMIANGHADLVIASYSITDERKKRVIFAGPYLITGQVIMVRAGENGITGVEDLPSTNKVVCSASNSTSLGRLLDHYRIPAERVVEQKGYKACVDLLMKGEVDAVSTDDAILRGYAQLDEYRGKVRLLDKMFSEERYGIGLAGKWHRDCERIVEILRQMIDDGSWARFVERNLGAEAVGRLPRPEPEPSSCSGPNRTG